MDDKLHFTQTIDMIYSQASADQAAQGIEQEVGGYESYDDFVQAAPHGIKRERSEEGDEDGGGGDDGRGGAGHDYGSGGGGGRADHDHDYVGGGNGADPGGPGTAMASRFESAGAEAGVKAETDTGGGDAGGRGTTEAGEGGKRAAEEEENDEVETSAVLDQAIQSKGIVCLTNMAWWTTDAEVQAACSEFGHVVRSR